MKMRRTDGIRVRQAMMMMMGASAEWPTHITALHGPDGRREGRGVREPTADRSLISMRSSSDTHVERVMFARTCVYE